MGGNHEPQTLTNDNLNLKWEEIRISLIQPEVPRRNGTTSSTTCSSTSTPRNLVLVG